MPDQHLDYVYDVLIEQVARLRRKQAKGGQAAVVVPSGYQCDVFALELVNRVRVDRAKRVRCLIISDSNNLLGAQKKRLGDRYGEPPENVCGWLGPRWKHRSTHICTFGRLESLFRPELDVFELMVVVFDKSSAMLQPGIREAIKIHAKTKFVVLVAKEYMPQLRPHKFGKLLIASDIA